MHQFKARATKIILKTNLREAKQHTIREVGFEVKNVEKIRTPQK